MVCLLGMAGPPSKHPNPDDGTPVGIVADSHGQVEPLAAALAYLRQKGCVTIYHLGDICDSLDPGTADACVQLLRKYRVHSVKGNNDHMIVANQTGRKKLSIGGETLAYLKTLPLVIHHGGIILAHSLPFESEMGLSCMVGAMHHGHARRFFRDFPDRILLRGHSHAPAITWQGDNGRIVSESVRPECAIDIAHRKPCIITCGALDHGLCMQWSPENSRITSKRFEGRAV